MYNINIINVKLENRDDYKHNYVEITHISVYISAIHKIMCGISLVVG